MNMAPFICLLGLLSPCPERLRLSEEPGAATPSGRLLPLLLILSAMLMRFTELRLRGDFDGVEVRECEPPKRALQCISRMAALLRSSTGCDPNSVSTASSALGSLHDCQEACNNLHAFHILSAHPARSLLTYTCLRGRVEGRSKSSTAY